MSHWQGFGPWSEGLEFVGDRIWGVKFGFEGLGFRVLGLGFRV